MSRVVYPQAVRSSQEVAPRRLVLPNVRPSRAVQCTRSVSPSRAVTPGRAVQADRTVRARGLDPPDLRRLHNYQKEGVIWLRGRKYALLGDQVGLGKTVQALRALPRVCRVVVVCPAAVVLTWQEEGAEWRPDLKVTVDEPLRQPDEGEILVISYDSLPDLRDSTERLVDCAMGDVFLILDECQMVMSDDAQRTKKVRRLRLQCGTCWGLSATPMLGDPEDLWGVLSSVGVSHIYASRESYIALCGGEPRYTWDKKMNRGRGGRRRIGWNWGEISPEVKEKLQTVMLRRLADDVLDDLPEVREISVPTRTPESLIPFLNERKDAWEAVGWNDLPPFELLAEARAALARAKINHAMDLADQYASKEHPILVFSAHVDPVLAMQNGWEGRPGLKGAAAIADEENNTRKKREATIQKFRRGELRILAMSIGVGGAGLNLQEAAGVLFVDQDWTPGKNEQAYGRARRQGNRNRAVAYWRMLCDHPLDRHLCEVLDEKRRIISAAVG